MATLFMCLLDVVFHYLAPVCPSELVRMVSFLVCCVQMSSVGLDELSLSFLHEILVNDAYMYVAIDSDVTSITGRKVGVFKVLESFCYY